MLELINDDNFSDNTLVGSIMDAVVITDEEGLGKCAWCDKRIDEDSPVYGFGIKFRAGVELTKFEGKMIELSILTENKKVPMMITIKGSDAKNDGHDAMFMTCSIKCGNEMKDALSRDKSFGDMLEKVRNLNN